MLGDVNKLVVLKNLLTKQCFAFTPRANFPAHNLNFHWRWMWLNQIHASFWNLFYFTVISNYHESLQKQQIVYKQRHFISCSSTIEHNDWNDERNIKLNFWWKKYWKLLPRLFRKLNLKWAILDLNHFLIWNQNFWLSESIIRLKFDFWAWIWTISSSEIKISGFLSPS